MILISTSAVLYGVWGLFAKIGTNNLSPNSVISISILVHIPVAIYLLSIQGFKIEGSYRGIIFAALFGLVGLAGDYFFVQALKVGDVGVTTAVSALYPVITIFLGYVVMSETLTLKQFLGVALGFIASYLIMQD